MNNKIKKKIRGGYNRNLNVILILSHLQLNF
jgi:hypothetical protein